MAAVRVAEAPLRALNTFGIAATARVLWRVGSIDDVRDAIGALRDAPGGPPLVLGGGSNLLLTGDLEQPVLQVAILGRRVVAQDGATVTVEALVAAGICSRARDGVKILGVGELKAKLAFEVAGASKSAQAAIEKLGGSVKLLAGQAEAAAQA